MNRGMKWVDRISAAADLQEESIPALPLVEIAGDRRVLIEHHCGVTHYGRERIVVQVKFGQIAVSGDCLELTKMTAQQLIISGCIYGVELQRR